MTEAEAHSWVEIYFAGYGWVPFEPTPAQPIPTRTFATRDLEAKIPPQLEFRGWLVTVLPYIAFGIILACCLVLGGWLLWIGWDGKAGIALRRMPPERMLGHIFQRISAWARQNGMVYPTGITPDEFAAQWSAFVHEDHLAQDIVNQLTDLYIQAHYTEPGLSTTRIKTALKLWSRLRLALIIMKVRRGFGKGGIGE